MRAIFPLTLAVSLAAHLLLAGGAILCCGLGATPANSPPVGKVLTLAVLFRKPAPVHPTSKPAAARPVAVRPAVMGAPAGMARVLPTAASVVARSVAAPNAHLPAPVPARKLDGTKGVVFILDASGSMREPYAGSTRLAFARQELGRRVRALPEGTPFAVVLYAGWAVASGPLVAANGATREAAVRFLMRGADGGDGADLPAGLATARALNTGALVLATDGALNIPGAELMLRAREILGERGRAPSLLVIGIAPRPGTAADHLLQDLADLEGGTYAPEEAPDETALLGTKADVAP